MSPTVTAQRRYDRATVLPGLDFPGDTFVPFVTEETTANTGCAPTALHSGGVVGLPAINPTPLTGTGGVLTIGAGVTLENVIIDAWVDMHPTARLRNALWRGPSTLVPTSGTGARAAIQTVNITDATDTGPRPQIEFVTFKPQESSDYATAPYGPRFYWAYRCRVEDMVDGMAAYSQTAPLYRARARVSFCLMVNSAQYAPDRAGRTTPRANTHNDFVGQFQGNIGPAGDPASDIIIEGGTYWGRYSPVDNHVTPRTDFNGATGSINTGAGQYNVTLDRVRMFGGAQTVNLTVANPDGTVKVLDCVLERPGSSADAPNKALVVGTNQTATVTGNVYSDNGDPVPRFTS